MLNPKMQEAINRQINAELYSYYIYLSMSAWFRSKNLNGFATWMTVQTQEEMFHAMKFFNYVIERGGTVVLDTIAAPPVEWRSPLDVFEYTYKHEQHVTALIDGLVDIAAEIHDHATSSFLQWFVNEQVEEEASADGVLQQLALLGDDARGGGLFMLDRELGTRVFTPPAATA